MEKLIHPLIIIIGPSGSGKDTILNFIKDNPEFAFPPTLTTREMRKGEKPGIYNFISNQKFEELIKNNAFIEYDSHFGNHYGTSKELVLHALENKTAIKQSDINGFKKIIEDQELKYDSQEKTIIVNSNMIHIYFVGILMESVEHTKKAILARGDDSEATQKRIDRMQEEYSFVESHSDFIITNPWEYPEKAAAELKNLIKKLDNGI